MNATRHAKNLLKDAFPSIWLQWHLMHRPKSAERELSYLGKVVSPDAVTVDVGANCGLYTRRLARLSRRVHAFEPSQQMARLLRRTSASNVSVHEIALSDLPGAWREIPAPAELQELGWSWIIEGKAATLSVPM